jgi:hypothetical protein
MTDREKIVRLPNLPFALKNSFSNPTGATNEGMEVSYQTKKIPALARFFYFGVADGVEAEKGKACLAPRRR